MTRPQIVVVRERWRGHELLSYRDRPATILDVLDGAVRHHGDRIGVADEDERCTYAAFAARVAGTATVLHDRGIGRGTALGVVGANSVDLAVLVFACAAAGVVMVGLSERNAPPRWSALLRRTGARALVAAPDHRPGAAAASLDRLVRIGKRFRHPIIHPQIQIT